MNKGIKIIVNYVLGPLIFLVLCVFIYWQITRQHNWRTSLHQVLLALSGPNQWRLWLVLGLMPVNWGIEARKWQLALRPIGGLPFGRAFRAIFTGAAVASFTPNRMGEYLGRILYIKEGHRTQGIALTIACSMAQLMITLVLGLAGIFYLSTAAHRASQSNFQLVLNILIGIDLLILISLTFIYFRLSWVADLLLKIPGARKFASYINVLENFDTAILLRILFLSFGRYIVFIAQYSAVFPVFGVDIGFWETGGGMSVVFLIMAVVPTFTILTELGLRWEASIQIMELFSPNGVGIFAASFAIWLINLIIPALIGSLFIVSIKLFKNR
ncbi:MAG TPA: lysylphosphatidylglycerol synthase domain-containing protein [Puia sp.]|nr:lysylphosphatidylglycerol synthase domain-containing protein [Puia sp.]